MANGILGTNTDILQVEVNRDYSGASGIFVDNVNNIISITGDVGKVYSGVEPIVVNNEENLISANSAPIGVQEPLYFVQDDDEALIIGLSGGVTGDYVPVSSIGTELYDGVPVVSSISGYKISAFKAAYATYATNSYESEHAYTAYEAYNARKDSNGNVISSYYQPKLDFSGIDGTITAINNSALAGGGTTYTSPSGTILVVDDTLEGTTSALEKTVKTVSVPPGESYFSAIPGYPFDRYILNRDEDKGGYAVILYGKWSQGFSVTIDNNFPNPFEIPLTSAGFNLSTYQGYFSEISAVKSEVVELALKSDLPTYQYDSSNKISAINGSAIAGGEFPTSANEAITAYQSNSANYLTAVNIPESATWNTVVDKLDTTAFSTVSGDFLTAHQDLSDYYKKTETSSKDEISNALQYVSANAGKVYEGVSPIVVNNVENKVSADTWTLSAGNNVTFVDDNVNKITRIDCTVTGKQEVESYVQTNSANIDDTVTSYQTNSGDYLKESELGYNAVDEVSAINGSAIAQYGAEKQWLVHDDTLVHASNSAQFALGVNLSAVAQLLGVDETVLYSNTAVSNTIDLNEACTNFNRLRLKVYSPQSTGFVSYHEIEPKTNELWFSRQCMIPAAQYKLQVVCEYFTANNAQNYKFVSGCRWYGNNNVAGGDTTTNLTGASLKDGGYITEIVGIGRK